MKYLTLTFYRLVAWVRALFVKPDPRSAEAILNEAFAEFLATPFVPASKEELEASLIQAGIDPADLGEATVTRIDHTRAL